MLKELYLIFIMISLTSSKNCDIHMMTEGNGEMLVVFQFTPDQYKAYLFTKICERKM